MKRADPVAAAAARIQSAWQSGRVCPLVARGLRARTVRARRLRDAGMLSAEAAARIAAEAEGLALMFAPLPVPT